MENYCHDYLDYDDKGIMPGCNLYPTKPTNVPLDLLHAINTAEFMRRQHKYNLIDQDISAVEFVCLDAATTAEDKVNAEMHEEAANAGQNNRLGLGDGGADSVL